MQRPPVSAQRSSLKQSWLSESLPLNLGPDQPWFLVFFLELETGNLALAEHPFPLPSFV